jgi:hypothetical protein
MTLRRAGWSWAARTALARPAPYRDRDGGCDWAGRRELMEWIGHSSPRAALIYQHATRERDEAIGGHGRSVRLVQAGDHIQGPIGRNGHEEKGKAS